MSQQENRHPPGHGTRDEGRLDKTSFAGVRIAYKHEDGVMVSGIAAEALPKDLRRRCAEALADYRAATGHEASWLFIDDTEEQIVVR